MLSSGANVIIWDKIFSSGMKCYHMGWNVIILDAMLSSGANVIIWDKMLSSKANVIMVSSGANVIIWCYHVMLSSGMITPPFFVFPGNFTHSFAFLFPPLHSDPEILSEFWKAGTDNLKLKKCKQVPSTLYNKCTYSCSHFVRGSEEEMTCYNRDTFLIIPFLHFLLQG